MLYNRTLLFIQSIYSSLHLLTPKGCPGASVVKNLPAVQETQVQSLGWKDPLGKRMTAHLSILAWRTPWMEELGGLQSMGSQRVRHNWVTDTPNSQSIPTPSSPLATTSLFSVLWTCFCFLDKFICAIFYLIFILLFICLLLWLCWVFIVAHRLSIAAQGLSLVEVHGPLTVVPPAVQSTGCRVPGLQ